MPKICPSCGAEAPDQFRFCGFCASALDVAPPPETAAEQIAATETAAPASEAAGSLRSSRRLVTMLFADLTNYTHVAARIDPEEMFLTIRRMLEELAQPVGRMDGRIDRYVGDGFLATFGIPEAHEDDPTRALLTALDMQRTMQALRREAQQSLGWDVQLRVGINIGPVISGQLDTGALPDASVFGHAVNVAHRLQQAARPGTILVSEGVYRLTRNQIEFRDPINLHLKGLDSPVVSYEVIGQRAVPLPSRGLSGRETPLIGRGAESAALLGRLQRLKVARQGLVAIVTGEPGIGKSRLVEEVLAPLHNHFTIVRASGSPTETTSYGLVTRLVENLAGIAPDDSSSMRQQRLDEWLAPSSSMARDLGPVLHSLVGGQSSSERLIGNPQQDQRRIYAVLRRLVAWQARRRAVLLVLDDLHWADPSSLGALAHIADLVHEVALGIIALARPSSLERLPPPFTEEDPAHPGSYLQVNLGPLSAEDSDQLLNLLLNTMSAPPGMIETMAERTSGNPLLMEEMVRMLLDQGVLQPTAQGWQVMPNWIDTVQQVPDTVNGLILSRYDRLEPHLKTTLDAAAALGHSFSLPLLLGVTGLPEPELRSQLSSLEQADFLRRASGSALPIYVFRHWLMQEAIYQTILQKERRTLHLRAAQVIQQMAEHLSLDMAARVGYHLERGQSRQAITFLMKAARRAADRYANEEAISTYQRIQALLDQHGSRQEEAVDVALGLTELLARISQPEAAREALEKARSLSVGQPQPGYRLADVLYQLGLLKARQGQPAEARAAFEAAAANLRDSAGSQPAGVRVSQSDVEREIGWVLLGQGQLTEARTRAEAALRLALQQQATQAAGSAHNLLAGSHYWAGQLAESVASALRALAIREQLGDVWGAASTQSNLGGLYYKLGQWAQAESFLRQAIFVQQEIGDHYGLGGSWNMLGLLLLDSGRFEEALHSLNQSIATLRGQEQLPALALRHLARGQVWLRLGVASWATSDLERSLDAATQVKNDDVRALALAFLAEASLIENDLEPARARLQEAEGLAENSGSLETRAEVARVRSLLRKAENDWERALEANRQALELFVQIGNRYEVARRKVEAAELLIAQASTGAVRPPNGSATGRVREALETFRQLSAQADIPRAENLLWRLTKDQALGTADEQAVVAVHIQMQLPDLAGASDARQEELAGLFSRLSSVVEKVGRERGALVATSGSGLTYLFSGPTADLTESLAQQAVQAALDALDAGTRINRMSRRQQGSEIGLSIGLASGRWRMQGPDTQQTALFASASPPGRLAAAAAALAGPNQVAMTGDIAHALRAAYELETVAEAEARAHFAIGAEEASLSASPQAAPLDRWLSGPVFRLGRARSEARLPQALPGSTSELIGRKVELSALTGWVDRLRQEGRGLVCYLEAEAGMGKTRLLDQVLDYAAPDVLRLVGKCESFRAGMSYWPLISILEQRDLAELVDIQPLQGLLGLRAPAEVDEQLLANLPPAGLRQELFARVRATLLQACARRPLLLVIEDIHWLDLSSLDLLDFLLPLTLEAPIGLMLVARAEMPGPHRALVRKAEQVCQQRYLPVTFGGLSQEESAGLITGLLGTPEIPDGLEALLAPFSGHPLSLEEAVRFLVESGWLWKGDDGWRLALTERPGASPPGLAIERRMPPTIRDLLLRRLDLLPSETLHVVQAAAVLGESFDHTVLSHVVGGPAVARRLSELIERGWLLPANDENPLLYRFKHTLTRETIYATLLTSKLRVLHQRAGEALESLYPEAQAENVEVLAYHFGNSSQRDKALGYLVRAGQSAASRHALAESLAYYQQARDNLGQTTLPEARLGASIAMGLADVHLGLGDPASAVADLQPHIEPGGAELPAELRAGCWRRLAAARRRMGQFAEALRYYETAREILAAARPTTSSAEREGWTIELGLAQVLFDMHQTHGPRARQQAEHVLIGIDRRHYPELAAEALNLLGGMARRQGDIEAAEQLVRDSLSTYQAYGNRSGAAAAYANLGVLAAGRQDVEAAHNHFAMSLSLREALGDSHGIAITRNNLGQLERNRGRFSAAIEQLSMAAERARHAELTPLLAQCLSNLGQAQALAGQRPQALATLDEAAALCQSFGLKNVLCEVLWKQADCLVEGSEADVTAAATAGQAALALAEELNSRDLRSEALRVLARVNRRRGQADEAIEQAGTAWQTRSSDANPVVRARFAAEYALSLYAGGQLPAAARLLYEHVNPVQLPESDLTLHEIAAALGSLAGA
jgi:adenylate cyclase